MAVNKNSTGYTIFFAVALVVICGTLLAVLATSLKPLQKANVENEKRQLILAAAGVQTLEELKELEPAAVKEMFDKGVKTSVFDIDGKLIEGEDAFTIDIVKEYKNTKNSPEDRKYPMFTYQDGATTKYVVPMAGNGLWGPVWAYVALGNDQNTIEGIVFDHKGETPGLGAKIKDDPKFSQAFIQPAHKIMKGDKYVSVNIVKGGVKDAEHEVDVIAGATITSNGVGAMLRAGFKPYMKAFGKLN